MLHLTRFIGLTLLLTITAAPALAQQEDDTCPVIAEDALDALDEGCATTGRNETCYGYFTLEAEPQPGVAAFTFEQTGDIVNVANLQTLQLSPMDLDAGTWGIALMRIQANLPDALPGQNVTFLLFGDVMVENAGGLDAATVELTAVDELNVRRLPSPAADMIATLSPGQTVAADGRLESDLWLRVWLPGEVQPGWVFAEDVTPDADLNTLEVVAPDTPAYGPMQAFYFTSGVGDAPCVEAPESGMLIQTPEGVASVDLFINEVKVSLGSTAHFQAAPDTALHIITLEGEAQIEAFGEVQIIPAGAWGEVPLDENMVPAGLPTEPMPFEPAALQTLPLSHLERPLTVPPAMPTPGHWHTTYSSDLVACPTWDVQFAEKMVSLVWGEGSTLLLTDDGGQVTANQTAPGVYAGTGEIFDNAGAKTGDRSLTLRVETADRITGEVTINFDIPDLGQCTLTNTFVMETSSTESNH
jgi:hypothetical protein